MTLLLAVIAILALAQQHNRIKRIEQSLGIDGATERPRPQVKTQVHAVPAAEREQAPHAAPTHGQAAVPAKTRTDREDEMEGGKWLGWLGMASVFVAAAFFLKYAFDNDWIGETGRVFIGFLAGGILVAAGSRLREKYLEYSQLLTGGGIAIWYASIYAGYAMYSIFGTLPAIFLMLAVAGLSIVLSLFEKDEMLAAIGFVGGYLTPLILAYSNGQQMHMLWYVFLLDIAALCLVYARGLKNVHYVAFAGTVLIFGSWVLSPSGPGMMPVSFLFAVMYLLVLLGIVFVRHVFRGEPVEAEDLALLAAAGGGYLLAAGHIVGGYENHAMTFAAIILATAYASLSWAARMRIGSGNALSSGAAAFASLAVAYALWSELDLAMFATALFIEACALAYVSRLSARPMHILSVALAVFALGFLDIVVEYGIWGGIEKPAIAIFNPRVLALLIGAATAFASLFAIRSDYEGDVREFVDDLKTFFLIAGHALVVYAISSEIRAAAVMRVDARSAAVTIFWALYAFALLAYGFARESRFVRKMGLVLLFVTAVRVFLDVWALGPLHRIVVSFAFGTIALVASYIYVRKLSAPHDRGAGES